MDKALEIYKRMKQSDAVVHIKEAVRRDGEYSEAYPTGYEIFDKVLLGGVRDGDLIIGTGRSGEGKCHGKGTRILMYDGSIKLVEDILVGDLLMGQDSRPRRVLSLARGREMLYRINSKKSEPYTVNESHILSLKNNSNKYGGTGIKNISVRELLNKSNGFRSSHVGYKVPIDFNEKELPLDPYFLGIWLGDGTSADSGVTTPDKEIVDFLYKHAEKTGMKISVIEQKNNLSNVYRTVRMRNDYAKDKRCTGSYNSNDCIKIKLREIGVLNNKHIPDVFKMNTRENRLKLLAGIIDSDGHNCNNCWEVVVKRKRLAEDIIFLCRSLGIGCRFRKSKIVDGKEYFRLGIWGELSKVPCLLERKRCHKRKQIKNPLHYCIKIEKLEVDNYYGFEIDGDGLYVLGDFSVTHNTTFFQNITVNMSKMAFPCLWFSYEVILENLYAKFKSMGLSPDSLLVYTPKQNTSGALDWLQEKIKESYDKYGTKFIFIDHIDYLTPKKVRSTDQLRMILKNVCIELKSMAVNMNIIIFLIAHVKKVQGRAIELQDIGESSGIGQLADTVFGITRNILIEKRNGMKYESFGKVSTVRLLKNRIGNDHPFMEFTVENNLIIPLKEDDGKKPPVKYYNETEKDDEYEVEIIDSNETSLVVAKESSPLDGTIMGKMIDNVNSQQDNLFK